MRPGEFEACPERGTEEGWKRSDNTRRALVSLVALVVVVFMISSITNTGPVGPKNQMETSQDACPTIPTNQFVRLKSQKAGAGYMFVCADAANYAFTKENPSGDQFEFKLVPALNGAACSFSLEPKTKPGWYLGYHSAGSELKAYEPQATNCPQCMSFKAEAGKSGSGVSFFSGQGYIHVTAANFGFNCNPTFKVSNWKGTTPSDAEKSWTIELIPCPYGHYRDASGNCVICPAGHKCHWEVKIQCQTGEYQPNQGKGICLECPQFLSSMPGSTSCTSRWVIPKNYGDLKPLYQMSGACREGCATVDGDNATVWTNSNCYCTFVDDADPTSDFNLVSDWGALHKVYQINAQGQYFTARGLYYDTATSSPTSQPIKVPVFPSSAPLNSDKSFAIKLPVATEWPPKTFKAYPGFDYMSYMINMGHCPDFQVKSATGQTVRFTAGDANGGKLNICAVGNAGGWLFLVGYANLYPAEPPNLKAAIKIYAQKSYGSTAPFKCWHYKINFPRYLHNSWIGTKALLYGQSASGLASIPFEFKCDVSGLEFFF